MQNGTASCRPILRLFSVCLADFAVYIVIYQSAAIFQAALFRHFCHREAGFYLGNSRCRDGQRMIYRYSLNITPDIVMPVPLANRRLFHRGYNQATLLSRAIARVYNVPIDFDSVHRKYRPNMGHKTNAQRHENIRGVFSVVNRDALRGKRILLVDDVMTSGATFDELARVLRRAGADAVYGVVFCRVVRMD